MTQTDDNNDDSQDSHKFITFHIYMYGSAKFIT